jgi:hypothetical protein
MKYVDLVYDKILIILNDVENIVMMLWYFYIWLIK